MLDLCRRLITCGPVSANPAMSGTQALHGVWVAWGVWNEDIRLASHTLLMASLADAR